MHITAQHARAPRSKSVESKRPFYSSGMRGPHSQVDLQCLAQAPGATFRFLILDFAIADPFEGPRLLKECGDFRSEERRVGKECRSSWSPYSPRERAVCERK